MQKNIFENYSSTFGRRAPAKISAKFNSYEELEETVQNLLPALHGLKKKGEIIMLLVVPESAKKKPYNEINFRELQKHMNSKRSESKGLIMVFMEKEGNSEKVLKKILLDESLCHCQKEHISEGIHFEEQNLTKREKEILILLEMPISQKEIAKKLFISVTTLRFHIRNIYRKLNVRNRVGAISKMKTLL